VSDPHAALDRQVAARHLLQHPLTCAERHPEAFRLIRRHEHDLDRWFTQRLGYRLHVSADTARLFKSTAVPHRRPLRTATEQPRPFNQREYVLLALILAAVAAGPRVISLRDLIAEVRSAAADAGVTLTEEPTERRHLVTALYWMIDQGLARELHERVERYATDEDADAVIEVVPDRVALVPLPVLARAGTASDVVDRADRRAAARQWMRARLVEDPVLYRSDLTEEEWGELRRRQGEEAAMLGEMFGLAVEARAEGLAAIDPGGDLSDRRFPATGTVGHAALLLLERLAGGGAGSPEGVVADGRVVEILGSLAGEHRRHWSKLADDPERLARAVLGILADHRLIDTCAGGIRPLPAASRFGVDECEAVSGAEPAPASGTDQQGMLW
jgi:uncharacterized protein (TIGR02678 family)